MRPSSRAAILAICASGLIAGTLDIGAAALINQLSPAVIVRSIASKHGGKVRAFSEGEGKGATISLALPRSTPS